MNKHRRAKGQGNRKTVYRSDVPVSVLMPEELQRAISQKAQAEERSFSGLVRHALKKELGLPEPDDTAKGAA